MTEPGRYLFVRLEPELHGSRQIGICSAIKLIPGVELVCDLSVVSRETLDGVLLTPENKVPAQPTERKRRSA